MLEWLKQWVITICTAALFITVIEIILPDNKLKKYSKFVLGLILMTVIVQPVIKVFNNADNINKYIVNAQNVFEKNTYDQELKGSDGEEINSIVDEFKKNLEDKCSKMLKNKYPDNDYSVTADVQYSSEKKTVLIKKLNIGVKNNNVKKIEKVQIDNDKENTESDIDEKTKKEIANYISDEMEIPYSDIKIYKL
ncbi:stage III sporulation protein AF [Clostridium acetobutylicum]|uniref:Stage III sporulation protein AF, SpoIIIAF n=1 Tax=Clostridium acetobutylicum (strain ATCC 824 / DSM 792 / JCM 1419 / IAM 19013 / LMG 5710 / NBRC 13948 / NRRL B-527 / VKM B-1787 / 2291 / W) TaxID=272562 RepID=Q97HC4_CLOAB|nr:MULTISPECIES: stage III sporulation protein AF [Clostridium]AAK80047.1 Stage III sporulation protein AF, SpoIIIAF [Clostridium acetobutylicum ATCC 824]ADZ21139.1 Stage III sporulation protein AF, SpoIIIAF [Clostridium acetobutylicum EA 2018]AEI32175.1 stage III sporulation protein AF, SpoIIIAF [Clostridium acetobutylicum DSM 1731]AWV79525.1 stage III sporulation protein AF [Clostridium acetobutylicum]MBC2394501.1 stage III sporulation protein AF [Clostridium acetobutylicum]